MSHLESALIWFVVLLLVVAEVDRRWSLFGPPQPPSPTPAEPANDVARQIIAETIKLRDEAKALRDYIELRSASLAVAETKIIDRATQAISSASKMYETDIRRLRDLTATQQQSIDRLTELSRRAYKADVEAGVFEHLAALARDRANALAGKKEL